MKNQSYSDSEGVMVRYSQFYSHNGIASSAANEKTKYYSFWATTKDGNLKLLYLDSYKNIGVKNRDDLKRLTNFKRKEEFLMLLPYNQMGRWIKNAL